MVTEIKMPKLGMTMKEGTIGKWYKQEGDMIEEGEILFEVETTKITKKIEAPVSGILLKCIFPEKSVIPVSTTIGFVGLINESLPEISQRDFSVSKTPQKKELKTKVRKQPSNLFKKRKISPIAKKLAEKNNIDITQIQGSGPKGRIVKKDILRAVEASNQGLIHVADNTINVKSISTIRKVISERLSNSHLTAVHVTITTEVDVTKIIRLRQRMLPKIEKIIGTRVSYSDIFIKIVTQALKEHPLMNSKLEGDNIQIIKNIHMGVAIALEAGLMVVVLHDADQKSIADISLALKRLTDRAKQGLISLDEISGSTFTITNLGMFGVETFTPIINPPESGILGIGRIIEKPAVIDGLIVIRSMMQLSLSFDHRIIDGAPAAKFLYRVKQIMENPRVIGELKHW